MNLELVLQYGCIVAADDWLEVVVVWDGDRKFEVFRERETGVWACADYWSTSVSSLKEAKLCARKRLANIYEQMEKFYGEAA